MVERVRADLQFKITSTNKEKKKEYKMVIESHMKLRKASDAPTT